MSVFTDILGGALKGFDPVDVFKNIIAKTSASVAKPVIQEFFLKHMNAAARVTLGGKLIAIGGHLQGGEVAKAAEGFADVIDDIKF